MRKFLLLTVALMLCWWTASPQAVFYADDFDSYAVGDYMGVVNPTWWTTWGGAPGTGEDCYVSDNFANTAPNSVFIDPDDGLTDAVLKLGNKTDGAWEVGWYIYVESGYNGYYNFQHFETPGTEWAFEIWFYDGGAGELKVGDVIYNFTFAHDTWVHVEHIINIDADWATFKVDGTEVHSWPFHYEASGTDGTNQLGGVDLWTDDNTYRFYIDDLMVEQVLLPFYEDDFEDYAVGDFMGNVRPEWWTTWGGAPGTGEDCYVSDAFAASPTQSVYMDPDDGLTDAVFKLGDKTSGAYEVSWNMYVEDGYEGYYNFQHFEVPGSEWAFSLYFLPGGNGELIVGDETFNFTFAHDTWFNVKHMINVSGDWATFYLDDVAIHSWPFHYQETDTTGTLQLGGIDFYTDDATWRYYIDDFMYKPIPIELYVDDFESYAVGDYIGVENPTWWTTWGGAPGTGEDALIVDTYANSPVQSLFIDPDDGLTDLVLKLGDRTSGAFDLGWYMYVESGFQAYYNIQHFETPGTEWAVEIWFYDDGTGEALVNNEYFAFTFTHDTWFPVMHKINIDGDMAEFYVDGMMIHSWPFSYESTGTEGTNQLGGVDFWTDDATYKFYIDDVSFIQTIDSQGIPEIGVSPAGLQATAPAGTTTTKTLTIENIGGADLEYSTVVLYDVPQMAASVPQGTATRKVSMAHIAPAANPNAQPAPYNPPSRDDAVLHYDGENASSYSWGPNTPYTITNAAMFPVSMVSPYIGMMIQSVDMYIGTGGTDFKLRIYEMGDDDSPGALIYEQPFTQIDESWNNVVLDTPVYLDGGDIWVGYQYHQPGPDLYIAGADAGPANPLGGFLTFNDASWVLLTDYGADANWNIRANITGDPISSWLSLAPASGTVSPAGSQAITATFDATGLAEGNYAATVRIMSNDPETPIKDVPVIFIVTPGGTPQSVILDFEDIEDWSLTFDDWTAVDVDGSPTYGITDVEFPHSGEPMAYICFNPATTDPPMTDPEIQPFGGERFGACMASIPEPTNDDWLISPQTTLGTSSSFNLFVKSYTDAYGLEKYNVGVSTTGMNPEDFTIINDPSPLEAPTDWTEMNFDISDYDGQTVYVAVQCVSTDAFIFMVDDISIDFIVGESELPANEARISVYPNPARDFVRITSDQEMNEVEILNQLGQQVYSQVVTNTDLNISTMEFESGVYYVRIKTEIGSSVQKLVIR